MKQFIFTLWQWTWGLPQTLVGAVIYLKNRHNPHEKYHGCTVTWWDNRGSMGVGKFLFIDKRHLEQGLDAPVLVHEFGHSVQSLILGPLFLPVMGLPSLIWCNLPVFRKMRQEKGVSYYRFYPERSANYLGSKVTGLPCNLK